MTEREPIKGDNRRAAMIAVATFAALLLAVGLATFSDLPQNASHKMQSADPQPTSKVLKTRDLNTKDPKTKTGEASWYDFDGQKTANGETMNARRLTAAHPTLPFGTKVVVENVDNGRTVMVRVNDRGPYADGRVIDVSKEAARKLGMVEDGVTEVEVAPLPTDSIDDPGEPIQ